jgi:hypothetical protein
LPACAADLTVANNDEPTVEDLKKKLITQRGSTVQGIALIAMPLAALAIAGCGGSSHPTHPTHPTATVTSRSDSSKVSTGTVVSCLVPALISNALKGTGDTYKCVEPIHFPNGKGGNTCLPQGGDNYYCKIPVYGNFKVTFGGTTLTFTPSK